MVFLSKNSNEAINYNDDFDSSGVINAFIYSTSQQER